jgi:hypothetical protein
MKTQSAQRNITHLTQLWKCNAPTLLGSYFGARNWRANGRSTIWLTSMLRICHVKNSSTQTAKVESSPVEYNLPVCYGFVLQRIPVHKLQESSWIWLTSMLRICHVKNSSTQTARSNRVQSSITYQYATGLFCREFQYTNCKSRVESDSPVCYAFAM